MIGDREYPDGQPPEVEAWGPLDAMTRLNPPVAPVTVGGGLVQIPRPPAWVERYGCFVIIRHTFADGGSAVTERLYPSDGRAVQGMAGLIGGLLKIGYTVVED